MMEEENGFIVIYLIASAIFMMSCPGKCPVCVRYLTPLVLGSLDPQYHLFCVGCEITAINSNNINIILLIEQMHPKGFLYK